MWTNASICYTLTVICAKKCIIVGKYFVEFYSMIVINKLRISEKISYTPMETYNFGTRLMWCSYFNLLTKNQYKNIQIIHCNGKNHTPSHIINIKYINWISKWHVIMYIYMFYQSHVQIAIDPLNDIVPVFVNSY